MPSILLPGGILTGRTTLRNYRMPTDRQALDICCAFSKGLSRIYPGYTWRVDMNQDVVRIINLTLHKSMGCSCPLKDFDVDGKMLMRLGGEILERYNQSRIRAEKDKLKELKRDIRGDAKPI